MTAVDRRDVTTPQTTKAPLKLIPIIMQHIGADQKCTFVAIADVELKRECIAEFKKWFSEVNSKILSHYKGFLGRVLIESPDGRHRIIIMAADKESFLAMRASRQHRELHAKALTFMTKPPSLSFYSIAAW